LVKEGGAVKEEARDNKQADARKETQHAAEPMLEIGKKTSHYENRKGRPGVETKKQCSARCFFCGYVGEGYAEEPNGRLK